MHKSFFVGPPSTPAAAAGPEEGNGGELLTRRRFLKRSGGASVAVFVAMSLSPTAEAHEPTGSGSWRLRCTLPLKGDAEGAAGTLSGAPSGGNDTKVVAQEFTSSWTADPNNSNVEYKAYFWGYLQSRAKKDGEALEQDKPVFTAGGKLGRQRRERSAPGQPWTTRFMTWNNTTSTWNTSTETDASKVTLRDCPQHSRNACIAVNRSDGSYVADTHAEGTETIQPEPPPGTLKTVIPIEVNTSVITGKAKFVTPDGEFAEIAIDVQYTTFEQQ